jgi:hypothetical protein
MTDAYYIPKRWRVRISYRWSSDARTGNAIELGILRRLCPPSQGRAA